MSKWIFKFVLFLVLPTTFDALNDCSKFMPPNYNKYHPPQKDEELVPVFLTYQIESIDKVDAGSKTFTLQMNIETLWNDERLYEGKKLKDYYNKFVDRVMNDCFWLPDITIEGLMRSSLMDNTLKKPRLRLGSHTTSPQLFFMQSYNLEVRCPMMFHWYPMDVQECDVQFKAFASTKIKLSWFRKIHNDSENLDTSYHLREIRELEPIVSKYKEHIIILKFIFARSPVVALITIYFPSALIVAVCFVSFWIDSQSVPGRISLIVTSLLALMTQLVSVRSTIPDISYITALDVWYFACVTFVSSTLFEFAVAYTQSTKKSVVSAPNFYDPYPRIKTRNKCGTCCSGLKIEKQFKDQVKKLFPQDMDTLSRYVFPLLFAIFCAIYWTTFVVVTQ